MHKTCITYSKAFILNVGIFPSKAKLFHELNGECLLALMFEATSTVTIVALPKAPSLSHNGTFQVVLLYTRRTDAQY